MEMRFSAEELRLIRRSVFGQMASLEDRNKEDTDEYKSLMDLYERFTDAIKTAKGETEGRSFKMKMAEVIKEELNDAYDALDRLDNYMPTSWDGVGWDGDASNQYGKDCVESKIVASISRLEKELEEYEQYER